jgi:hypothetical protein
MKDYIEEFDTKEREQVIEIQNPLSLDIEDSKLAHYFDKRIKQSEEWFEKEKNLKSRQKKNFEYIVGKQLDEKKMKDYQARYIDNVIYEIESIIKPIALSRLPDLFVTQGVNGDKDNAKRITDYINSDIKRRENRRTLAIAFKHLPIGFIGAIKYRWNPEKGRHGDYEFFPVHYSKLTLDHNAKSNDVQDMEFVAELTEMSVKELIMRFPKKKKELFERIGFEDEDETNENKLATKLDIHEIWFKWYEKVGDKYKQVSAVSWKYRSLIFDKIKNPNWDYEGKENLFTYDDDKNKKDVKEDQIREAAMNPLLMAQIQTETVYSNYFEQPEFPYIFLGYDQFATMPYDETSRIEQNIIKQDNVNKRGKQITEMADRAKGKHVFSTSSGIKKEDLEDMDIDNPDNDLLLDGALGDVHQFIPGELPSQTLYQDQELNRKRMFESAGTNSTTRGQVETDVATTAQIARESDFGRIDDLVEDTINYAAEKMARASLQMIKLYYTKGHLKYIMGKDGEETYKKIQQDMIEDGMEVIVHASGTDKIMRKREAYEKAKMKMIDPLSFFEDTDTPRPKERTERLVAWLTDPATYQTKYLMGLQTTDQMAQGLSNAPLNQGNTAPQAPVPIEGDQQAAMDIAMLQQGQEPQIPQSINTQYLNTIQRFLLSPEFSSLNPSIQQIAKQYALSLVRSVKRTPLPVQSQ